MSNEIQKRSQSEKSGVPPAKKAIIMTRSSLDHFDWKTNCLFCGKTCITDEKHPVKGEDVHHSKYKEYSDIVLKQYKEIDDQQARVIEHRVRNISDFVAEEACYHNTCRNLFNLKVKTKTMAQGMKGRPSKDSDGFETLCEWMESEGELYTLDELRTQLQLITNSKDVYCTGSIKHKLQDKYVEDISFSEVHGQRNVVCLSNVASTLLMICGMRTEG